MRVPTANYQPLQNSISNKYNAKSGANIAAGLNIASQGVNISKSSLALTKKSQVLNEKALEIEKQHSDNMYNLNKAALVVGTFEKLFTLGLSQAIKAETAYQNASVTNKLLDDYGGAIDTLKQTVEAGTTKIDNYGQVKLDSSIADYTNNLIATAKDNGWSDTITQQYIAKIKTFESDLETQAVSMINAKATSNYAEQFQIGWDKALGMDTSSQANQMAFMSGNADPSQLYSSGAALLEGQVASESMDVQTGAMKYNQYHNEANQAYAKNGMVMLAQKGGSITLDDGTTVTRESLSQMLMQKYGFSIEEINKVNSIADTAEKNYMEGLKSQGVNAMQASINSYDTDSPIPFEQAEKNVRASMEADGQSEEHIQEVVDAMDSTAYNWNLKRTDAINANIQDMPQGELITAQEELIADHKAGWYSGSSETLYNKTYTNITNEMTAEAKAKAEVIKDQVAEIKTQIDTIVADTELSTTEKVSMVQNMLEDKNVNVLGSDEDDKYMKQTLAKLIKEKVKTEYQPYADSTLDAITIDYASNTKTGTVKNGKITYDNPEQELAILRVKHDAQTALSKVIDGAQNMTFPQFTEACDKVRSNFLASAMASIDKASLTHNASGSSVFNALGEIGADAIYVENGQYQFYDTSLAEKYAEATSVERDVLSNEYGIETKGLPTMYEASGTAYPFPVYTTENGKKIVRTDEGFFYADSNVDVVKYPELGIKVKPVEKESAKGDTAINAETSAQRTREHRTAGLGDSKNSSVVVQQISKEEYDKSADQEQSLVDDIEKNLNSKAFNNKKNALVDFYVKSKGYPKERAVQVVDSLITGMRQKTTNTAVNTKAKVDKTPR